MFWIPKAKFPGKKIPCKEIFQFMTIFVQSNDFTMYLKKILYFCYFISIVTGYAQNHFVTTWNTETGDAESTSIWTGSKVTFTKANGADWNLPANQDRITDNVALTRKGTKALFNIIKETHAGNTNAGSAAPADTEWAYGTTADYTSLTYKSLPALINGNGFRHIAGNRNMVLHLITDDIYIDIKFLSWTNDNLGGGFSYERSTPPNTLVINEIFADPLNTIAGDANGDGTGNPLQDEFIELYNTSKTPIDLSGWKLTDAAQDRHIFPEGTLIPPEESLVVFGGGTPGNTPGLLQTASEGSSLFLDDTGDTVTLKNASDTVITSVTYGAEAGDDRSIARNPDFTGNFVKHTAITTNNVRFSPGRDNTDGSALALVKDMNHFVTTWNTQAGESGSTSITLPVVTGAYDVDTDNDGTFDRLNLTGTQTLDLGSAGVHTIAVRPNAANRENELQILFANGNKAAKLTTINNWGTIVWKSMRKTFRGCSNMNIAAAADTPDLSKVTDMSGMFRGAASLNSDLSSWNVANVTDMSQMFQRADTFNGDVSTWNVSKVTNMTNMFYRASKFNGDVSTWNVLNVTDMNGMFLGASAFNGDLSSWNVAKVADMRDMFLEASAFNGNLSTWDVSKVTNMNAMFLMASVFNGDLSTWNVAKVTDMASMFEDATVFNGDVSAWNVASVTDMGSMFQNAVVFNGDVSAWNVASVTNMSSMFEGATVFNGDVSLWNVSKVTDMSAMFHNVAGFNSDVSAWNVASVTDMSAMFYVVHHHGGIFNSDVSAWNVANVTNMSSMFHAARVFNGDVSAWNVAKVTDMSNMFRGAIGFTGNLSAWNVASVTNMREMFRSATGFNSDVSAWNVANVTNMHLMFGLARSFNGDLSAWNVSKVTDMNFMFSNATSFSRQNYEKLLSGWSELTLQNGVTFTAPSVSYCFGKAARDILTDTYGWRIKGDSLDSDCLGLNIAADALLQGPYNSTAGMMNDDLRTADRIPLTSPYNDGATVTGTAVFDNTDDGNDIVDWVQIELRNSSDITEVLTTASALIQRDGDIVAPDGTSDVTINGTGGDYYVSVNHRNHIAAATTAALTLSATATAIDFTAVANVTGGTNAMAEVSTGKYALFAGDADGNNQVQTGDYNVAATRIGQSGYFGSDTDMNGEVQITDLNLFIARAIGNGIQF